MIYRCRIPLFRALASCVGDGVCAVVHLCASLCDGGAYFTFLCFSFLACEMETIKVTTSELLHGLLG